jgi:RND family efflux transporter MFP subunit
MNSPEHWQRFAIVFVAAALLAAAGCSQERTAPPPMPARPVKTLAVGGVAGFERSFPGLVRASNQVNLSFRVGGQVIEYPVRDGQAVRQGQLVGRIDPKEFEIRLDSATADFERADADLRRISALYEKDAVAKADLDGARAARDMAAAAVEDAKTRLDYTYLRAPFSGRIGETLIDNFEYVTAKQPVLSLIDVTLIDILVDVPEGLVVTAPEFGPAAPPGRLVARFDGVPGREFGLSVKEVATQADPRTQTYRVTLTMPQPEGINVFPGMTANVVRHVPESGAGGPIIIPAVAVFADPTGAAHVWIVDPAGDTVTRRRIETGGPSGTDDIQVVSGLEAGETIAVSGVTQLREGMQIRPIDEVRGL